MRKIYPSLLSANFLNLKEEISQLEAAQVDGLHFDVMDGLFVPNISIGIPILEAIRPQTTLPIDVHLMIENPEAYIQTFAEKGADLIAIHVESTPHIHRGIQLIKSFNKKAGVVINPGTPVQTIEPILELVDYVLVMTVNPGFGGQSFISSCISKIKELNHLKNERELDFEIEVDGGINDVTIDECAKVGATMFVTGSYFFKQNSYSETVKKLKG